MISNRRAVIACKWVIIIAAATVIYISYIFITREFEIFSTTSQSWSTKCYWNVSENSFSPGGTAQDSSLKTAQQCQRACMNTHKPACLAFDFNPGSSDGKYCWFTAQNQPVLYGNANGVFHYNWVCNKDKMHKSSSCSWNASSNSHSPNGVVQTHVISLHQCKRECMTTSNCLGIDWNPSSKGSQCWFSPSSTINYNVAPGIDHHHLVCSDKTLRSDETEQLTELSTDCSWMHRQNHHSPNGNRQSLNSFLDPNSCQMGCLLTSGCYAIDWNVADKECWFSTSSVVNSYQGVDHYQFVCASSTVYSSKFTMVFLLNLVPLLVSN